MKRSALVVGLVFFVFFVISLLTNILNSLLPAIRDSFGLSLALAGFLPFSFFVAYGPMSIPAGMLVERFGERSVLVASFVLAFAGSLLFATMPSFGVALLSVFLIGAGMAMLQVAINPLLRVSGGAENFAFLSVMGQLVFGLASFLSPQVYSGLVRGLEGDALERGSVLSVIAALVPDALPWLGLYWIFAAVTLGMIVVLFFVRLPVVVLTEEERPGALDTHRELLGNKTVLLYFLGIFCYVGTEQGVANWISEFLRTYHGMRPEVEGAAAVSGFWGAMTVGCLAGLVLLKLFDSRRVLVGASIAAMATLLVALTGQAAVSFYAFQAMGFAISVMWSIIFSLALNSLPRHHGSFSGILCTGIVGGAILPLAIGGLGDRIGLRLSMAMAFLTLGYILSIGLWARPLVSNKTLGAAAPPPASAS